MIKYAFEYFKSYSIGMQLKMQTMQILFISIEFLAWNLFVYLLLYQKLNELRYIRVETKTSTTTKQL